MDPEEQHIDDAIERMKQAIGQEKELETMANEGVTSDFAFCKKMYSCKGFYKDQNVCLPIGELDCYS